VSRGGADERATGELPIATFPPPWAFCAGDGCEQAEIRPAATRIPTRKDEVTDGMTLSTAKIRQRKAFAEASVPLFRRAEAGQ